MTKKVDSEKINGLENTREIHNVEQKCQKMTFPQLKLGRKPRN
jgi:hypothetical protein